MYAHIFAVKAYLSNVTMHRFIVYLIVQPGQAAVAEMFSSELLQVWVENGGGFNVYPARHSAKIVRRVSDSEWALHERHGRLKFFICREHEASTGTGF